MKKSTIFWNILGILFQLSFLFISVKAFFIVNCMVMFPMVLTLISNDDLNFKKYLRLNLHYIALFLNIGGAFLLSFRLFGEIVLYVIKLTNRFNIWLDK